MNQNNTSFFRYITTIHGPNVCDSLKSYARTTTQHSKLTARKMFLLQCRKTNITPRHIVQNVRCVHQSISENTPFTKEIDGLIKTLRRKLLNIEIKITFWKIAQNDKELQRLEQRIKDSTCMEADDFVQLQQMKGIRMHNEEVIKLQRKIDMLKQQQLSANVCDNAINFVHNATNADIPDEVKLLCGLGPRFALPTQIDKVLGYRLIADVESIIKNCECETAKDTIRLDVTNALNTAVQHNLSHSEIYFNQLKKKCSQFIADNPKVMILRSDKGAKTVFMHRDDYNNKVSDMLNDTNTYTMISDPTSGLQTKSNTLVKRMHEAGCIDDGTKRKLTTYTAISPLAYFVPKPHKANLPLRPIVADLNGPTRNIAKFIADTLNQLPKSEFHIRNSYEFQRMIVSQKIENGCAMVSFDVVSLFTNSPISDIRCIIEERWPEIQQYTGVSKPIFIEMFDLCTRNCYFTHNNKVYKQIFGTPMGSPISCDATSMLMDEILESARKKVRNELNFDIKILKKYVDDIFMMVPATQIDQILAIFNGINQHIQFTCERENDNSIPFLDMLVRRHDDGKITTEWYRKPISSGRILNYESFHPLKTKISTAYGLIDRVVRLTSDATIQNTSATITDILLKNGYPKSLINRLCSRYQRQKSSVQNTQTTQSTTAEVKFASIAYVQHTSERIAAAISKHIDCKIAFKTTSTVSSLFTKLKDKIPIDKHHDVVYAIPCGTCNNWYIGNTSQLVRERKKQHQRSVNNREHRKSALAQHSIENQHTFNFDGTKILTHCNHTGKRFLIEEMFIKNTSNCVNIRSIESNNVNDIYNSLFTKLGNRMS